VNHGYQSLSPEFPIDARIWPSIPAKNADLSTFFTKARREVVSLNKTGGNKKPAGCVKAITSRSYIT
jgi:hypothetical protein